jgi:hypothetical protein
LSGAGVTLEGTQEHTISNAGILTCVDRISLYCTGKQKEEVTKAPTRIINVKVPGALQKGKAPTAPLPGTAGADP